MLFNTNFDEERYLFRYCADTLEINIRLSLNSFNKLNYYDDAKNYSFEENVV